MENSYSTEAYHLSLYLTEKDANNILFSWEESNDAEDKDKLDFFNKNIKEGINKKIAMGRTLVKYCKGE